MTDDSPSKQGNLKNEPKYDPGFVPAFRAGMNRLSKAEVKYLDSVITPEVAFLLTKAFGAAEGGKILRSGREAMESLETNISVYREDLSNPRR